MKKRFVEELSEGELVQDTFLVKQSLLKTSRSGGLYLDIILADRTGSINSKFWDASRKLHESFGIDDFVVVRANVESYQGRPQLSVTHIKRIEDEEISLADFMPASGRDPEDMLAELRDAISRVEDPELAALLDAFFSDEEFMKAFARCPAAVSMHHAYIGGLLEHTLSVTRMAFEAAREYGFLDAGMLVAGALLHDIGKIYEIEHRRSFAYSDRGSLLGHLTIGASEAEKRAAGLESFDPEKLMLLQHIILSHHGQYEFGSPKLPMTAEAMALHYLDNLDAKMQSFKEAEAVEGNWTQWSRMFERRLYVPPGRGTKE